MKKIIIFFAALAALLSCTKENPSNYNPVDGTYSVTLTASAPGADTKTTLVDGEGTKFVHWSKGDAIKVLFFPHCVSHELYSGPSGVFYSHFEEDSSDKAAFRIENWSWNSNNIDLTAEGKLVDGIAVYPHTATAKSDKVDGFKPNSIVTDVSYVLPSSQRAVKNNIESGLNFSYASVDKSSMIKTINYGSETKLSFKNACAMIELTMPTSFGDKKVTSISIISNDDVALTGKGKVNMVNWNDYGTQNIIPDPFTVSISSPAGVTLSSTAGFEAGAKYYVVVWPGVHNSGLTIKFTAEDGSVATKTTPAVTLKASKVKPYTFNKGLVFELSSYDYVYSDGTWGNNPKPSGKSVVGVVFFNGNPRENDPALPEYCTHGLAISLAPTSTKWIGSNKFPNTNFQSHGLNSTSGSVWGYTAMCKWKDLYSTDYLQIYKTDYGTLPAGKTSGWYHGTNCEWDMISKSVDEINEKLKACGKTELSVSSNSPYWVALGYTATYMYIVKAFTSTGATYGFLSGIGSANYARPIFAF